MTASVEGVRVCVLLLFSVLALKSFH